MNALRPWLFFFFLCLASVLAALMLRGGKSTNLFVAAQNLADNLRDWVAEREEPPAPSIELPDVNLPPLQSLESNRHQNVARTVRRSSAADHTRQDVQACNRPPTRSRNDTGSNLVYKWIDQEGQTHLSDKPPSNQIASVIDMAGNKRDFTYSTLAE